jgi:hypothetical protein
MNIQINTDKNVSGNEKFAAFVTSSLTDGLSRFSDHITRIEAHFSDENGSKPGPDDKRCMLEARLQNKKPIAVSSNAATVDQALRDAMESLKAAIETILGRREN